MGKVAVARALRDLDLAGFRVEWLTPSVRTPSGGIRVAVRIPRGASHDQLFRLAPHLAVALRSESVRIEKSGPVSATLTTEMPFGAGLPPYPTQISSGEVPARTPWSVPLGRDADGYPVQFTLFDDAGGTVSLIAGSPGTGKSSTLRLLMAALAPTRTAIVWLDPKSGADAAAFSARAQVCPTAISATEALRVIHDLNALVRRRVDRLARLGTIGRVQPVVVLIDEWAALGVDGSRKDKEQLDAELRRLAATGRAALVSVVLATQRPTSTTIDVATRSLAATRLCFAVGDQHASIAALGVPGAEQLNPLRDRGTAYLDAGCGLSKVRIYGVPTALPSLVEEFRGLRTTLDTISSWEQ